MGVGELPRPHATPATPRTETAGIPTTPQATPSRHGFDPGIPTTQQATRSRYGFDSPHNANLALKTPVLLLVMSKTKGQTFRYRFRNETNTFWYRSRICLVENRLFGFCPESALLDQIERIPFDGAGSGTNLDVLVSFLLDF